MSGILSAQYSTLQCAANHCIPCLYKLFPAGLSDLKQFIGESYDENVLFKFPSNVRPETCPRSQSAFYCGLYTPDTKILTVGDGDLSFSNSLSNAFVHLSGTTASNLTSTTHESLQSVSNVYHDALQNIEILKSSGSQVLHGVDATNFDPPALMPNIEQTFDIIIWNFPCIRIDKGADGQVSELEQNKALLRGFFRSAKTILNAKGELHITHKTIEPFSWWGIESIAAEEGYSIFTKIVFDKCSYPGYVNRKVLDRKSFPCNDARTFVFVQDEDHQSHISSAAKVIAITSKKATKLLKVIAENISDSSKSMTNREEKSTSTKRTNDSQPSDSSKRRKRK